MTELRKRVLVVDDEPSIRESLQLLLKSSFDVQVAANGQEALSLVEDSRPDLILLDVLMPQMGGMDTLRELRARNVMVPVVMLTATTTVKTAVQAMKCGAVDYLNKPFDVEELTSLIVNTLEHHDIMAITIPGAAPASPEKSELECDFGPMVGRAPVMTEIFHKVGQVAERDTVVLITGESGTGKELVARQIHDLSPRRNGPFVAINCAAIPETLIESELFGHEKGAFTHAIEKRIGHFELANKGTLFLDEIGELSLAVQVKMLRFLQEQEFYRVGRSKPITVDVRIIAATNKDLEVLIEEKKFRQDLFYRVNVVGITTPPLRDRFEDIPALVHHFVDKFSPTYGKKKLTFTPEALNVLVEYSWPGNVRELENAVESLMALCPCELVTPDLLPRKLRTRNDTDQFRSGAFAGDIKFEDAERMFESDMILKALRKTNYVQTRAAELLGISRRILKYKMDKLGISDHPEEAAPETAEPAEEIETAPLK